MKAFVTSIGERTTELCVKQLKKYGFEVVLLGEKEDWLTKYKKFIGQASQTGEDVLRIDADIIPNRNIAKVPELAKVYSSMFLVQFSIFDFYKYDIGIGQPLLYKKEGLSVMLKHLHKITGHRPETEMSRLPQINDWMINCPVVMGTHGFFQTRETFDEAYRNKDRKGQLPDFDFPLAEEILDLYKLG